jgi:uncharacterized protein YcaQ
LRERVLAKARIDAASLREVDASDQFVPAAVRALGLTQARWIADFFRSGRKHKDADLDKYVASGELVRVTVAGWDLPAYVHREHLPLLKRAQRSGLRATHTTLLSPFDPVVWDRARASALFGFDYTLECYTPGHKRRYGYFVLPILHRGRLIGRLDAKAHRAEGMFEVKTLYLEPSVKIDDILVADVALAIQASANWHETPRVVVRRGNPSVMAQRLRIRLKT